MSTSERPLPSTMDNRPRSVHDLAYLSQGFLTVIVRLQARRERIPDAETFRRRTIRSLDDLDRDARQVGYSGTDIENVQFALVAFLDSVVLNSSEPGRAEWERQSLAMQRFNVANAGEVFFEKLNAVKSGRESDHLADTLEVFLLCMLLGFKGRYSRANSGELSAIIESTRHRIESIRGKPDRISPSGQLPDTETTPPTTPRSFWTSRYPLIITGLALCATVVIFIVFKLSLSWMSDQMLRSLLTL